ncbi:hypothetical protein C4D60_Mb07t10970 [Musa balbisiana]|uniref:Uncharacterized protein n=1 Tax=Musa balbisiana TaxID=52838 RepID=A0A4S8JEP1_MUSBA|nr:hypothetical protein C4D60_Mb07t10970 [Musa balbisiana]
MVKGVMHRARDALPAPLTSLRRSKDDEVIWYSCYIYILGSKMTRTKNGVIGQLTHQTRVVTFDIRADLAFGQGERARVGKGYPWIESRTHHGVEPPLS